MKKRILWLSNCTSQRKYEVPFLLSLGYEVYCPKVCGYGLGESFLSVSYEYDSSLSLDPNSINKLNENDLYAPIDIDLLNLINEKFDIVFCPPFSELLRRLIHHFNGVIVLRWNGDEKGLTCTERLIEDGSYNLLSQICTIKDRFYFAYAFPWQIKDECDLLRGRSVYLPLPIESSRENNKGTSVDGLVICPNVMLDDEAKNYFHQYLKNLKFSFKVLGEQLVLPVNYQNLYIGNHIKDQKTALEHTSVVLDPGYRSTLLTEPWLLVLAFNLPLLYTKNSEAFNLFGENSPGFCSNFAQSIHKFKKIHGRDANLSRKICEFQNVRLNEYTLLFTVVKNIGQAPPM